MDPAERRKAYDCDITYGTNSEFGFDYLRDNMKPARWGDPNYPPYVQQCQKALNYAIIDEVDNILIDEARTPLIISGNPPRSPSNRLNPRRYRPPTRLPNKRQTRRAPTQPHRGSAEEPATPGEKKWHLLRDQGEGAHLPPDR